MATQRQEITSGIFLITEQRATPAPHFVYSVENARAPGPKLFDLTLAQPQRVG